MTEQEVAALYARLTEEERRSWDVLIGSDVPPYTDESEAARIAWRMAKDLKQIVLTSDVKAIKEKLTQYHTGERLFWARYGERHPHDRGVIDLRLQALDRMLGGAVEVVK